MSTRDDSPRPLRTTDGRYDAPKVGTLVEVDEQGRPWVTFEGAHGTAVLARSILDAPARAGEHPDGLKGASVLLQFEQADPRRPIVVGLVRASLRPEPVRPEVQLQADPTERDVVVDGQRLVFDAKQEILLRCGKSTLLLRADGKVLLRGVHLVSRASGPNRIKGGNISLN